ncbi:MAG TPA: hypothetical protein VM686_09210 [Polyangiaceae bacterium]|nr:hypothetical protein [Polyangiaceae bacterium]
MATISEVRSVKVWLNGHDFSKYLSRFRLAAGPFDVTAEFAWIDAQANEFDHCAACARRDKVELVVQFGSCPPCTFTGRLVVANAEKGVDISHQGSATFCGEPV